MNLDNIASLAATLSKTGFGNLTYPLLQHICCKPARFFLTENIVNASDRLSCQLCFERHAGDYVFVYYDASLIREQAVPAIKLNGVELQDLEQAMVGINWKETESSTVFRLNDASTWEREKQIEHVMNELARLSVSEEGKAHADMLRVRFFSATIVEQLTGSLAAIRSKLEISQRFYITAGEGITVDEALRFLQNRWVERRMVLERRKLDKDNRTDDGETDGVVAKGKKLLQKGVKRNRQLSNRSNGRV